MRIFAILTALWTGFWFAGVAPAQEAAVSSDDWDVIRGVISHQLEAFERDDAATAFSYATPALQEQFGNAEKFVDMVQQSYAPVYRPQGVTFLEPSVIDSVPVQPLRIVAGNGAVVVAFYFMERHDGEWKISGCQLVPIDAVFAAAQIPRQPA